MRRDAGCSPTSSARNVLWLQSQSTVRVRPWRPSQLSIELNSIGKCSSIIHRGFGEHPVAFRGVQLSFWPPGMALLALVSSVDVANEKRPPQASSAHLACLHNLEVDPNTSVYDGMVLCDPTMIVVLPLATAPNEINLLQGLAAKR